MNRARSTVLQIEFGQNGGCFISFKNVTIKERCVFFFTRIPVARVIVKTNNENITRRYDRDNLIRYISTFYSGPEQ